MTQCDGADRTLDLLARVPTGFAATIVLRHAEREDILPGTFGNDVPLTLRGLHSAHRLGMGLSSRTEGIVMTSPLLRCTQTADAIIAGSGWETAAKPDRLLGDPGPFVTHPDLAGQIFLDSGIEAIVSQQLAEDKPPDGMRPTSEGVQLFLDELVVALADQDRINLFVTHDAVLAVFVGYLYGFPVGGFSWPDYLDALVMWLDSDGLRFLWRGLGEDSYPIGG